MVSPLRDAHVASPDGVKMEDGADVAGIALTCSSCVRACDYHLDAPPQPRPPPVLDKLDTKEELLQAWSTVPGERRRGTPTARPATEQMTASTMTVTYAAQPVTMPTAAATTSASRDVYRLEMIASEKH